MPHALLGSELLGHGIHVIDTGFHRPHFDASYLIVENGHAAFIDTGTSHSVPRLLAALSDLKLAPEAVDWVIVTHVHLDHAGGAGRLMQSLPAARCLAHPRAVRHLVNPGALLLGARVVYGEAEVERAYGHVVPIPAERIVASNDGMDVQLAGRALHLIDTPGHARHHHCIWDERSRGFFTGDTFGLSYREFDGPNGAWLLPTTTPVQFDPDALRQSVQRMLSFSPQRLYLTHYGCVDNIPALGEMMLRQIDEMVDLALTHRHGADRHERLKRELGELYVRNARAHGSPLDEATMRELLAGDIELNAQGLAVWLDGLGGATP